jgi:hypothetical protein
MAKRKPYKENPEKAAELVKHGGRLVAEAEEWFTEGKTDKHIIRTGDVNKYLREKASFDKQKRVQQEIKVDTENWRIIADAKEAGMSEKEIQDYKEAQKYAEESMSEKQQKIIKKQMKKRQLGIDEAEFSERAKEEQAARIQLGHPGIGERTGVGRLVKDEKVTYQKKKFTGMTRGGTMVAVLGNEPLMIWDTFQSDFGIHGVGPDDIEPKALVSGKKFPKREIIKKEKSIRSKRPFPGGVYQTSGKHAGKFVGIPEETEKERTLFETGSVGAKILQTKADAWNKAGNPYLFWSDADGLDRLLPGPIFQPEPTHGKIWRSKRDPETGEKLAPREENISIYNHSILERMIQSGRVPASARVPKSTMTINRKAARNTYNIKGEGFRIELGGKPYTKDEFFTGIGAEYPLSPKGEAIRPNLMSDEDIKEKGGLQIPVEYGNWGHFICDPCNLNNEYGVDADTLFATNKKIRKCRICNRPDWWMFQGKTASKDYEDQKEICSACADKDFTPYGSAIKHKKKFKGGDLYGWNKDTISTMLGDGIVTIGKTPQKTMSPGTKKVSEGAVTDFLRQVFG